MENGLHVVGTPIGNLSDLTHRAVESLRGADVVYAEDTRRTGRLLKEIGSEAPLRSLHEHNEAARTGEVVKRLREGERCVLVTDAGTPGISDPGRRVVEAVREAGLGVVSVPGPSAVTAALSVAGLPADRFVFLGFPPRSGGDREAWMERLEDHPWTAVVFEAPGRVADLLSAWRERGLGDRVCVLCRELTKLHEEVVRSTVAELAERLAERRVRGEVTLVLEGAEPSGWEARRDEVRRAARRMLEEGGSTRDVSDHLQETFGVPRNAAYEMALDLSEERES